jgi:hypothetical protein
MNARALSWGLLTAGTLACLSLLAGPALWQPNEYLLVGAGDGLTPYYAHEWQWRHGGGAWFRGLGYPQGIHSQMILFPLLDGIGNLWKAWGDPAPFTVAMVNLFALLPFIPAAWAAYVLLGRAGVSGALRLAGAWLMIFLSSHVLRIAGHYNLTWAFFIPVCWLLLAGLSEGRSPVLQLLGYGLLSLLAGLAHPYYLLIGAFFGAAYLFLNGWMSDQWEKDKPLLLLAGLAFSLPGLAVWAWRGLTWQGASDFLPVPYGFTAYRTGIEGFLLPAEGPLFEWIQAWLPFPLRRFGIEGRHYIGLSGSLLLLHYLWGAWRRGSTLPPLLRDGLRAGLLLLLPATAIPLRWFPDALAWLGPLAQFRAPGRLGWALYFPLMLLVFWHLHRLLRESGRPWLLRGAALALLLLWGAEAFWQGAQQRAYLTRQPARSLSVAASDLPAWLAGRGRSPADFQAMLVLPYFHFGSEKFHRLEWGVIHAGLVWSAQSGLPLCDFLAARAPLSQALRSVQLAGSFLLPKPLLEEFPDDRPLLLCWKPEGLAEGERQLVAAAEPLGAWEGFEWGQVRPSGLAAQGRALRAASLAGNCPGTERAVWLDAFGDSPLAPGGQMWQPKAGVKKAEIARCALPPGQDSLELSAWVLLDRSQAGMPHLELLLRDGTGSWGERTVWTGETLDIDREFAIFRCRFPVPQGSDSLRLRFRDRGCPLDNLLICAAGDTLCLEEPASGRRWVNNWLIAPPAPPGGDMHTVSPRTSLVK